MSRTTVGFWSPSIKCRPTSKLAGVTKANQSPERYGVSTGTKISQRRSRSHQAANATGPSLGHGMTAVSLIEVIDGERVYSAN